MATTTGAPWNITYPTTGDNIAPLETVFANQATSVHNALNTVQSNQSMLIGTDAARLALIAPTLRDGLRFRTNDTDRDWLYNGSAWVPYDGGSYILFPTSVVGGTIGADGAVTFSGVNAVSLNGVFTSRFRTYIVKYSIDSRTVLAGAGEDRLRLRLSGTDSSANYGWSRLTLSGGTVGNTATTSDAAWAGSAPSVHGIADKIFRIERPAQAVATRIAMVGTALDTDISNISLTAAYGGYHTVATAYDGITLLANSGNITGSISVIGIP